MASGILSVVVGFILWGLLWVGSNQVLLRMMPGSFRADGSTSNTGILLALLIISILISIITGYLAALIGQQAPVRSIWILSILVLITGILVQAQYWATIPLWFNVLFLVALIPSTLLGGWLRLGRMM
jgi:hypothetical protein